MEGKYVFFFVILWFGVGSFWDEEDCLGGDDILIISVILISYFLFRFI